MFRNLESSAEAVGKAWINYKSNRSIVTKATRILTSIERHKGKISNQQKRLCDDYAVTVLGSKSFAPWLYVYTAMSGKFKEGWIPDNYYKSIVIPNIKGEYGKISSLQALNAAIFRSVSFPDLLSYVNGIFFDPAYQFVAAEDVKQLLFSDQDRIIFKLDNHSQGRGIRFFNRDTFDANKMPEIGSGLFQKLIKPHEIFWMFSKEAVATIRITTVYEDDGEVSVRACYLRLGSASETHVQSKSHIRVPIDLKTGAFNEVGYTPDWSESKTHPTSKLEFSGNTIPSFIMCIKTVTELHKKVPYARCIGWDVTVDNEDNVKLMEWNAKHNDIRFSEATQGPCFADLGWEKIAKKSVG